MDEISSGNGCLVAGAFNVAGASCSGMPMAHPRDFQNQENAGGRRSAFVTLEHVAFATSKTLPL